MTLKKLIYIFLGCIGLGLGTLGSVLPMIPSIPFLLMAHFASAKAPKNYTNGSQAPNFTKTT